MLPFWERYGGEVCHLFVVLCVLLLAVTPVAASDETGGKLCVWDASGAVVGAWPMRDGQGFVIRYTHSVALTPVEEHFVIKDGGIWLDKTIYQDFGAGLPSTPESGQRMSVGNGCIVMGDYNRPLVTFDVRVGRVAGHALLLHSDAGTQEIALAALASPGSALTFTFAPQGCGAGPSAHESFQRQP